MTMLRTCAMFVALVLTIGCGGPALEDEPEFTIGANNIYMAAIQGDLETVKSFIERGSWDPGRPDGNGLTPLSCAIEGGNVEIVRLMVEQGADVNEIDARLMTPLEVANKAGKSEIAQVLKELGATK